MRKDHFIYHSFTIHLSPFGESSVAIESRYLIYGVVKLYLLSVEITFSYNPCIYPVKSQKKNYLLKMGTPLIDCLLVFWCLLLRVWNIGEGFSSEITEPKAEWVKCPLFLECNCPKPVQRKRRVCEVRYTQISEYITGYGTQAQSTKE